MKRRSHEELIDTLKIKHLSKFTFSRNSSRLKGNYILNVKSSDTKDYSMLPGKKLLKRCLITLFLNDC